MCANGYIFNFPNFAIMLTFFSECLCLKVNSWCLPSLALICLLKCSSSKNKTNLSHYENT